MNANKTNSRINPSKEGFNFKERIKGASSGGEIDSILAGVAVAAEAGSLGGEPSRYLYKLKSLAKRKKAALAKPNPMLKGLLPGIRGAGV